MSIKYKRSYKFAFFTSTYITLFLSLLILIYQYYFFEVLWLSILIFALLSYVFSFFIIQLRIEYFIYKRVKSVYDSVALLDAESINPQRLTSDMKTLTAEVERFAKHKRLEIETLKGRDSYRKEFMGNVAHELKTPLFTVQGYILTLLDGALQDEKVRDKYLARASKGLDRLIYIVKDLDMITKLEAGDISLFQEKFDINELLDGVHDLLEMKASKKEIEIIVKSPKKPIFIKADKERIRQVLANLVVNSIKYGKKEGKVILEVEEISSLKIKVTVSDNGEGVKPQNIPRLFERFYRVDKSGSRKEGGSGLGLSIVKHIVEAHHEKVSVDSEYGVGSKFSFTLTKYQEEEV